MKRSILVFVVGLVVGVSFAATTDHSSNKVDLSGPYTPSRQEWLELSVFKEIKGRTDTWEQRIGFAVAIVEKENTVFVTLTPANGEGEISPAAATAYVETVKDALASLLGRYEWARGLKVHVQFR
jgi:hypothetical protein